MKLGIGAYRVAILLRGCAEVNLKPLQVNVHSVRVVAAPRGVALQLPRLDFKVTGRLCGVGVDFPSDTTGRLPLHSFYPDSACDSTMCY